MRRAGFSLVELAVAGGLVAIVMLYVMQSFTSSQQTYTVVEQVSEVQQNLRIVADLVERDIRLAGYMVPKHAGVCAVDNVNAPDMLFVSSADAIRTVAALEAIGIDEVTKTFGAEATVGTGTAIGGAGTTTTLNLTNSWADVSADGSDFTRGMGVIVVDANDDSGVTTCGIVTDDPPTDPAVSPYPVEITFSTDALPMTVVTSDIRVIPAHVYQIVDDANGIPQLLRDGVLIADEVEDLQLEFFFDADDDGLIDAGEYMGDLGQTVEIGRAHV